jgi:hypothetical protein
MAHTKICVTSQEGIGCTFVDWSIHFLNGQTTFFNISNNQWINLTVDPLSQVNAHNHKKNHPRGCDEVNKMIDCFDQHETGVFTFYPRLITLNQSAKKLNLPFDKNTQNPENLKEMLNHQQQDYEDIFKVCAKHDTKIIYLDSSPEIDLYHTNFRGRAPFLFNDTNGDQADIANEFEEYFFGDTVDSYKKLTNIWDLRERRALNARPFQRTRAQPDFGLPHLWIDSRSFWTLGEQYMQKILAYANLKIDNSRLNKWRSIYANWQNMQFKHLDFCHILPHTIDSIINNWDYEFGNLTFEQEIVIQHCLIYQHNLNLKTWKLDKFPTNAKDLHVLLEPNIHQVDTIY